MKAVYLPLFMLNDYFTLISNFKIAFIISACISPFNSSSTCICIVPFA